MYFVEAFRKEHAHAVPRNALELSILKLFDLNSVCAILLDRNCGLYAPNVRSTESRTLKLDLAGFFSRTLSLTEPATRSSSDLQSAREGAK